MAMYEGKTEEEWNKEADKYWRKYLHSGSTDLDAYHEYVTAKQNARHARNMSESGGDTSVTISGSKISNSNSYQRISGTNDNDSITNTGHHATIYGGAGNDTIENSRSGDALTLAGSNAYIDGGAGNDIIFDTGSVGTGNTINGGEGNDKISLGSSAKNNLIQYAKGDGNDVIYNLGTTDTLSITGGSYSSLKSGSDIILTVDTGKITLYGAANLSTLNIKGTLNGGSDTSSGGKAITNYTENTVLTGTNYADSIRNSSYAKKVTINALGGDDSIENFASNVSINGGAGNDSIKNFSSDVSINGGTGNDSINNTSYGTNVTFLYVASDGNDIVYGFHADSTLSITGSSYSTTKSGNDVIVTVGDGKITLIGAANLSMLNIKGTLSGGSSTDTTPSDSTLKTVTNSTKSPVTIASDMKTVDASKRTKAVKITGNELGTRELNQRRLE